MGNNIVKKIHSKIKCITKKNYLFLLLMLFEIFNTTNLYSQFTLDLQITTQICVVGETATVTCSGSGGTEPYEYSSDNITFNSNYQFSGLSAGNYTFYIKDATTQTVSSSIVIPNYPSLSITGQDWTCPSPAPPSGTMITNIIGGAPPYQVSFSNPPSPMDGSTSDLTHTFTGLSAGTYTVNFTSSGCTTIPDQTYEVAINNNPPYNCDYPVNYSINPSSFVLLPSYTSATAEPITLNPNFMSYSYDGNSTGTTNNDSIKFIIDNRNYTNIEFQITAHQSGGSNEWGMDDLLEISIKYGGESNWTRLFYDNCSWLNGATCEPNENATSTTSSWISLGVKAVHSNDSIMIRCLSNNSSEDYSIDNFQIRGIDIRDVINPNVSGKPENCEDDISSSSEIVLNYVDLPINWFCNETFNEFSFIRRWTPTDGCNPVAEPYNQLISVGNPPTVEGTPLPNITFDYCHNLDVDITAPTSVDDCDGTPVISWRIFDTESTPNEIGQGTGNIVDFDFPNNHYPPDYTGMLSEERFTIYWSATDDAGITSNPVAQTVIFLPEIVVTLVPNAPDVDFCSGEEATFTISATGGTGVFEVDASDVTPAATTWSGWSTGTNSVIYTTNLLTNGAPNITITIPDSNNPPITGGCPPFGGVGNNITFPTAGTPEYTVHPNITTGTITRTP